MKSSLSISPGYRGDIFCDFDLPGILIPPFKALSIPHHLGLNGFDAPENVRFHRAHLADEDVGLLFVIEHHLVGDLSRAELFTFP
jgi:hypothetical protein